MKCLLIVATTLLVDLFITSCKGETVNSLEDEGGRGKSDSSKRYRSIVLKTNGKWNDYTTTPYYWKQITTPSHKFNSQNVKSTYSENIHSNLGKYRWKGVKNIRRKRGVYRHGYRNMYRSRVVRKKLHRRRILKLRQRFRRQTRRQRIRRSFRKRHRNSFNRHNVYRRRHQRFRKKIRERIYRRKSHKKFRRIARRCRRHKIRQHSYHIAQRIRDRGKKYSYKLQRYGRRIGRIRKRFKRHYVKRRLRKGYGEHFKRLTTYKKHYRKYRNEYRIIKNKYLNSIQRKAFRKRSRYDHRKRYRRFYEGKQFFRRSWGRFSVFKTGRSLHPRHSIRGQARNTNGSAYGKPYNFRPSHRPQYRRNKQTRNKTFQKRRYVYKRHFIIRHYHGRIGTFNRSYATKRGSQYSNKGRLYENQLHKKFSNSRMLLEARKTYKRKHDINKERSLISGKNRLAQDHSNCNDEDRKGKKHNKPSKDTYDKAKYSLRTQHQLSTKTQKHKTHTEVNPERRILPLEEDRYRPLRNYYQLNEDRRGETSNYQKDRPLLKDRYMVDSREKRKFNRQKTTSDYGLAGNPITRSTSKMKNVASKPHGTVKKTDNEKLEERERKESKVTGALVPHRWILEEK